MAMIYSEYLMRKIWELSEKTIEYLYILSPNGKIRYIIKGDENSVPIDQRAKRMVVIHNHPSMRNEKGLARIGTSFSAEDIEMFVKYKVREAIVVTGTYIFTLKPRIRKGALSLFYEIHDKLIRDHLLTHKDLRPIDYVFLTHIIMKEWAKQTGSKYTYCLLKKKYK